MIVVSVTEMITIERDANDSGLSYDQMMVNAGSALAETIHMRFKDIHPKHVLGLIGSGNNGGDTLIALDLLISKGWDATAFLVKKRKKNDLLIDKFVKDNGRLVEQSEDPSFEFLEEAVANSSIILDGILGTGFKLPLKDEISATLRFISTIDQLPIIIAVDCPSGIDCDSGEVAENVIHADLTVCMAAVKKGMLKFPAFETIGELQVADIGLSDDQLKIKSVHTYAADKAIVKELLPSRPINAHKGTFGTCMVVGGSTNYCGAPLLAAKSAYKVGAGLVRTAVPGAIYDAIAGYLPESTWIMLPHALGVISSDAGPVIHDNLDRVKALLVGPGIGRENETLEFMKKVLQFDQFPKRKSSIGFARLEEKDKKEVEKNQPAIVMDADALRFLVEIDKWEQMIPQTAILTPHPGEMAALTGKSVEDVERDREYSATKFAQKCGHIIVLKGAVTIIATPQGGITYIPIATPALATAGTGDVLAGMITGLIAQGLECEHAAIAGAWLHAKAGQKAAEEVGQSISITASDVIDAIPFVLKEISGTKKPHTG